MRVCFFPTVCIWQQEIVDYLKNLVKFTNMFQSNISHKMNRLSTVTFDTENCEFMQSECSAI